MRKINLLFGLISLSMNIYAQDVITTKKGEEIKAKIIEVNPDDIKYKRFDNLEGPLITILKTDLFMIVYENGNKDVIEQPTIVQ